MDISMVVLPSALDSTGEWTHFGAQPTTPSKKQKSNEITSPIAGLFLNAAADCLDGENDDDY
jgi:hypothetical protein